MNAVLAKSLGILAFACLALSAVHAQEVRIFDSRGLPGSHGVVVRVSHPAHWKQVEADDPMALAELRGAQGKLTGILQIGRGSRRTDMEALCRPGRALTMLQSVAEQEPGTRVTDVFARSHEGRPAFEIRYERSDPPDFLLVRSVIVCLKDTRLLVSCAGESSAKAALADIEPVCRQVLDSLAISEE